MADTEISEQDVTGQEGGPAQVPSEEPTHHPSVGEYVEIGAILAVLTALEVALYYANIAPSITIPMLIALTIAKFILVVLWFMHLRFDSKVFRRFLWAGMVLAGLLYTAAIVLVGIAAG